MDFIMEEMESVINENIDDDWTNEEPEEVQEDNEDVGDDELESDISSEMDEDELQHQDINEEPVLDEDTFHHDNMTDENEDNTQNRASVKRDCSPSFTGLGKCKCGCGSFVGCGSICEACGHSYKAHGPY